MGIGSAPCPAARRAARVVCFGLYGRPAWG